MRENGYFAGWDGGGTKTAVEFQSPDGGRLARMEFGPLNPNGGSPEAVRKTVRAVFTAMDGLPGGRAACRAVCIGGAGMASNEDARRGLESAVRAEGYAGPLRVTGDLETALYGAFPDGVGAILIAGTGSVCFGQNQEGTARRAGGWGSLMDDEGSGYALGRDILAAVVRAWDGRGPATCLTEAVFARWDAADVPALVRRAYDPGTRKLEIAALAPLLDAACGTGDAAALAICAKAARELTALTVPVLGGLSLQTGRLALLGSLLRRETAVRAAVRAALRERWADLTLAEPEADAAAGAARLAREMPRGKDGTDSGREEGNR